MVTVCGLACVLIVTDELLQVGFLKKDTVDDWAVGCVYKMSSGARNAWVRWRSANADASMEQSIGLVKALLCGMPAYMCFVVEP